MDNTSIEEKIVDEVIATLMVRKGFDHWWENLDADIQYEIRVALDVAVKRTMQRSVGS